MIFRTRYARKPLFLRIETNNLIMIMIKKTLTLIAALAAALTASA